MIIHGYRKRKWLEDSEHHMMRSMRVGSVAPCLGKVVTQAHCFGARHAALDGFPQQEAVRPKMIAAGSALMESLPNPGRLIPSLNSVNWTKHITMRSVKSRESFDIIYYRTQVHVRTKTYMSFKKIAS